MAPKTTAMCWHFVGSALFSGVFAIKGGMGAVPPHNARLHSCCRRRQSFWCWAGRSNGPKSSMSILGLPGQRPLSTLLNNRRRCEQERPIIWTSARTVLCSDRNSCHRRTSRSPWSANSRSLTCPFSGLVVAEACECGAPITGIAPRDEEQARLDTKKPRSAFGGRVERADRSQYATDIVFRTRRANAPAAHLSCWCSENWTIFRLGACSAVEYGLPHNSVPRRMRAATPK